jgi:hypothetical protein
MMEEVSGVRIPDSVIARRVTEYIRDTKGDLLFHHSVRVYLWGALKGRRESMSFDSELLYAAAMFHDLGLTTGFHDSQLRFEVDGANAARDFLRGHGLPEADLETVWNAIALHTTPGIPEFMRAEIALVQAGAGMDVAGRGFDDYTEAERAAVVAAAPREARFEHGIIDAFYEGMRRRPATTFGTFNDDVLAYQDPQFRRVDMCSVILSSKWTAHGR